VENQAGDWMDAEDARLAEASVSSLENSLWVQHHFFLKAKPPWKNSFPLGVSPKSSTISALPQWGPILQHLNLWGIYPYHIQTIGVIILTDILYPYPYIVVMIALVFHAVSYRQSVNVNFSLCLSQK
jgi:hypothetical protein